MKILLIILAGLAALGVGGAIYVRLAPSDPALWHVDPATAPDPTTPNFARADMVIPFPPEAVAARIAAIAQAEGAVRLAGDAALATWVTRSRLMRFPDYTSIRLDPVPEGTRLRALARARFGIRDLGVNRARLDRWLASLIDG